MLALKVLTLLLKRAIAVAQLAEQSLPTSEIFGSFPTMGEVLRIHLFVNSNTEKSKRKEKEARIGPFLRL